MGMGPLGIGTKYQKKAFCDITVDEALNKHMEYTHYRVDSDLVQTYFNKSADTIEWLEDMGVEFAGAFRYFRESEATWHIVKPENGVIGPRAAGPMVRAMTEKAKELGAEIYLETPATGLIMEDGKCVGVKAVDKNGEEIEARGKAVVVATGGFFKYDCFQIVLACCDCCRKACRAGCYYNYICFHCFHNEIPP